MTSTLFDYFSPALKRKVVFKTLIPDNLDVKGIVLLLHGKGDDYSAWTSYTNVSRYNKDYLIIMPSCDISFYVNRKNGEQFCSYLTELYDYCKSLYKIDNDILYIIGNSMGGYGTLNFLVENKNLVTKAFLLSPALYLDDEFLSNYPDKMLRENINKDITNISTDIRDKIYLYCGKNDFLYEQNQRFSSENKIKLNTDEHNHSWDAWEEQIRNIFDRLI